MKILNLYAGLGGNSLFWKNHDVTAIEYTQEIANCYQVNHPSHKVIVADAHQFLLEHFEEFDFIWSSPPCQSHSKMIRSGRNRKPRYPDFRMYEEILFLQHNFKGKWVVENVKPYYQPLVEPSKTIGRHLFWSNFDIPDIEDEKPPINFINDQNLTAKEKLCEWLGLKYGKNIYYEGNHCPTQVLRNCVHPNIGEKILLSVKNEEV
jgi:DNA (cytosine-5)-methyltransferase 1|tara:strand:+ start:1136 stop:1753 length:618 start_codon:yes stop_codon:yes gene_type:complete